MSQSIARAVLLTMAATATTVSSAIADNATFMKLEYTAEAAYQRHMLVDAELNLIHAIDAIADDTRDKDNARAHYLLAKIYSETGRPQKADEQLQTAQRIYKRLGLEIPTLGAPSAMAAPLELGAPPSGATVERNVQFVQTQMPSTRVSSPATTSGQQPTLQAPSGAARSTQKAEKVSPPTTTTIFIPSSSIPQTPTIRVEPARVATPAYVPLYMPGRSAPSPAAQWNQIRSRENALNARENRFENKQNEKAAAENQRNAELNADIAKKNAENAKANEDIAKQNAEAASKSATTDPNATPNVTDSNGAKPATAASDPAVGGTPAVGVTPAAEGTAASASTPSTPSSVSAAATEVAPAVVAPASVPSTADLQVNQPAAAASSVTTDSPTPTAPVQQSAEASVQPVVDNAAMQAGQGLNNNVTQSPATDTTIPEAGTQTTAPVVTTEAPPAEAPMQPIVQPEAASMENSNVGGMEAGGGGGGGGEMSGGGDPSGGGSD